MYVKQLLLMLELTRNANNTQVIKPQDQHITLI